MSFDAKWTDETRDILDALTGQVRLMTLSQISAIWDLGKRGDASVSHLVSRLVKSGLLSGDVWHLPKIPIGEVPLVQWEPKTPSADMNAVERQIADRWSGPCEPVPVVSASQKAARLFGSSSGGHPPPHHRNHDLLLAAVYVRHRLSPEAKIETWIGEDALPMAERGIKHPDAFVVDRDNRILRVVESAGRYSVKQLLSFHDYCFQRDLPYELW